MSTQAALEALRDLPSTREQADRFAEILIAGIKEGETDPLKLRVFFKHLERMISIVSEACEEEILREAEKYGTKFQLMDADIQIKVNGSRFAYDQTGDPVIQELQGELEELQRKIKAREKFLQAIPEEGLESVDDRTGELTRIFPPYKKGGKTGLSITIGGAK